MPYWKKWMKTFPNLKVLADSEENNVLLEWQGLGYYSRAKRIFKSSKILINLSNGTINFNNSIFNGDLGNLKLINSNIQNIKDDLIFSGNFTFNVLSQKEFYRLFQINKKNRKKISNFYFDIEYNLTKNKFKISNLIFDPGKVKLENELSDFLNANNDEFKINNWIDFKIFVQKIFVDHYEG